MPSKTDLANDALGQIGQTFITNIDDDTETSNLVKRFLDEARDAVLREHNWGFARKRVELAATTTPVYDWNYAYVLPADNLRIIRLGVSDDIPYAIEGNTLVSNDATAFVLYIRKVEDTNLWDAMFYQLVSTLLASKLAMPLASSYKMASDLYSLYQSKLLDAQAVDRQEGMTLPLTSTNLTTDVRE